MVSLIYCVRIIYLKQNYMMTLQVTVGLLSWNLYLFIYFLFSYSVGIAITAVDSTFLYMSPFCIVLLFHDLCIMCPCEGLHLSYALVVESYQACQPGGQSAADAKLTHTHTHTKQGFWVLKRGTMSFMPVPEVVGGHRLTATVIDLSPWVEYEFRVLASNTIGTGEPSKPSKQARTKGTCMYCMKRKTFPYFHTCTIFVLSVQDKYNIVIFFFFSNFIVLLPRMRG